jgi:hypothetical protein
MTGSSRMTRKEKKLMYDLLLVFLCENCGLPMSVEYYGAKDRIDMMKKKRGIEP